MSSRTKSFFEQNHKNKPRPAQWHRPQNKAPLNDISNVAAQPRAPKPPIPANAQSKTKLKAFQFVPGGSSEHDPANNENVAGEDMFVPPVADLVSETEKDTAAPGGGAVLHSNGLQLPHGHTYPCTPGARLPLEDLIGNYDEHVKKGDPEDQSPEEHVGWVAHSSTDKTTPHRKRKRARSSSPSCPTTSSQRQEPSVFFAGTTLPAEKDAPEIDPAADLWQRYGTVKQVEDVGDAKLAGFNHLMFQASPKALETPAKGAGLRRWASTGNDWPSSKTKRRRTTGRSNIALWQDQQDSDDSTGKSKVAAMVEKLQESLASQKIANPPPKSAVRAEELSSSSPLPGVGAVDLMDSVPSASPLQTKQQTTTIRNDGNQATKHSPKPASPLTRPSLARTASQARGDPRAVFQPSEGFNPAPLYLQSKAPLPAYKRPSITRKPSSEAQKTRAVPTVLAHPVVATKDLDEFGDDLDFTAEDLDELMSQPRPIQHRSLYEIPPHPNPPPQQQYDVEASRFAVPVEESQGVTSVQQPIIIIDDENDEFGCDDIDEASLAQVEFSATQAFMISPRKRNPRKSKSLKKSPSAVDQSQSRSRNQVVQRLQRYVVKQVVHGQYSNAKGQRRPEKLLLGEDERTSKITAIALRDSWVSTSVSVGNIVHIAHHQKQSLNNEIHTTPLGQVTVSDVEGSPLLIVHPDHMLSATTVADSFDCIRKAVLQDRIKATGDTNKSMVYGKILHELFQQALSANRWDNAFLFELVERTVQNHVEGLWELGMDNEVLAVEEVKAKMGELASWAKVFIAESPPASALVEDKQGEKSRMSISKLIAMEEHIWSPQYGLKGNIDATVQTTVVDHMKNEELRLITPFEVKTGRTTQSPAHRAQTALYTLLLSDRYDVAVKAGILYYLESSAMSRIAPPDIEIRQMVQQRNRLASYIHRARNPPHEDQQVQDLAERQSQEIEESGLPGLLKNPYKCGRCYARQSCFSYHALVEHGSADTAGMVDDSKKNHSLVWHEAVGHLQLTAKTPRQAELLKRWFTKWDRLLTFEENSQSKLRNELWTMTSAEREAMGRCFGNVVISQDLTSTAAATSSTIVDGIEGNGGKINRFAYVFVRSNRRTGQSFAEGTQLTVGETVVVSSESGQWALANGYVIAATRHDITVAVDRKLGDARQRLSSFDDDRNQSLKGIVTVGQENDDRPIDTTAPMLYRLDKDEFSNGLALVRNNLVTLMSSHPIHTKLRGQIVHNTKPSFTTNAVQPTLQPSQLGDMNEDQRAAVSTVLNAQDYALILGMPGTGKTTSIAHIIRALLAEEKTILLTSFTHTAVDNILLKIRDIAPSYGILRLGVPAKINTQVQEFCQLASTARTTIEEVDKAYMSCQIVATTCMGTNHALFNRRAFDVCIVDEASQITLPTSLGPLSHARKFVLVGDHYQLPPLVQNKRASEGGLDVSLFRQLSEAHPQAVTSLGKQYRMCEDIMSLSNALIYDGRLRCGSEEVAKKTLQVANPNGLVAFHSTSNACTTPSRGGKCWLESLTKSERKVVFASTDLSGKEARETLNNGKNITNQLEATLTAQLVLALLALGVPSNEIGIITLYRSQLALLRRLFKVAGIDSTVEIDSADRFQGRDKECIILSMVRSNEGGIVGDLLKDWRRVNVALTRARSKLIVLGSRQTLANNELLAKLLHLVDERGWAVDLSKDAVSSHAFNFSSQAASEVALNMASPAKPGPSKVSPRKTMTMSPRATLRESFSAGNRSPLKPSPGQKKASKVINGRGSIGRTKLSQAAIDIFEDLTADDF